MNTPLIVIGDTIRSTLFCARPVLTLVQERPGTVTRDVSRKPGQPPAHDGEGGIMARLAHRQRMTVRSTIAADST
ncbi:MAG: hypothetical protein ABI980_05080 [Nitrospirota bacterium]